MDIPRLGVKPELQLPAYTTVTAMQDPSGVCDLHHSSGQCRILNPLSEAWDRTCNLSVPSGIRFCCATMGTPLLSFLITVLNCQYFLNPPRLDLSFPLMRFLISYITEDYRLSSVIFLLQLQTYPHTPTSTVLMCWGTRCPFPVRDHIYFHISQDCSILFSILLHFPFPSLLILDFPP